MEENRAAAARGLGGQDDPGGVLVQTVDQQGPGEIYQTEFFML
jgi:hypothetical protein